MIVGIILNLILKDNTLQRGLRAKAGVIDEAPDIDISEIV